MTPPVTFSARQTSHPLDPARPSGHIPPDNKGLSARPTKPASERFSLSHTKMFASVARLGLPTMTQAQSARPKADDGICLSWMASGYIGAVVAGGLFGLLVSIHKLQAGGPHFEQFYYLLLLTILSSFIPVKLPNVSANISVSETFVFAGTLLYGSAAGVPLVFIDALLICLQMARRRFVWHRLVFSIAAPGLSIWAAASVLFWVVNSQPLAYLHVAERPPIEIFALGLVAFTLVYFLLNSWLVAFAIALEQHKNAAEVWTKNFSRLWINYAG